MAVGTLRQSKCMKSPAGGEFLAIGSAGGDPLPSVCFRPSGLGLRRPSSVAAYALSHLTSKNFGAR